MEPVSALCRACKGAISVAVQLIRRGFMSVRARKIDANPESYGSKGQLWHPRFVSYMASVVLHPHFSGMPDAVKPDGKIQWEAPSNRRSGEYKDTNNRRREWWRKKAVSLGIDMRGDWISRTAKEIHPTGQKPCKRCGVYLRIAYAYPSLHLVNRASGMYGTGLAPGRIEEIGVYLDRLVTSLGPSVMDTFPNLLRTNNILPPQLGRDLSAWINWLEKEYIPSEPSLLSPGAMSNAPDRFDGFHSFNRCCRNVADTGRHNDNLRSYVTDRRAIEFWSDGDWVAANNMMGLIRRNFQHVACADGGQGPTADHVGPISLGFMHRPDFRILSRAANSAKNNRMSLQDIQLLIRREEQGVAITSWYAAPVWNALKYRVSTSETALRLSKIMRDNQRAVMGALGELLASGHSAFLVTLLNLHFADYDVVFENLRIHNFNTVFDSVARLPRTNSHAQNQKVRRIRVGFEALTSYIDRSNRHRAPVDDPRFNELIQSAIGTLGKAPEVVLALNRDLAGALVSNDAKQIKGVVQRLTKLGEVPEFLRARILLQNAMQIAADELTRHWESDRYVRVDSIL